MIASHPANGGRFLIQGIRLLIILTWLFAWVPTALPAAAAPAGPVLSTGSNLAIPNPNLPNPFKQPCIEANNICLFIPIIMNNFVPPPNQLAGANTLVKFYGKWITPSYNGLNYNRWIIDPAWNASMGRSLD